MAEIMEYFAGDLGDILDPFLLLLSSFLLLDHFASFFFLYSPVHYQVVITAHGQVDSTHYIDPRSKQVFAFDHMRLTASDPQPHNGPDHPLRKGVDDAFVEYVAEHYATGAVSVFVTDGGLTAVLVANKYNPRNYWNGRWRSQWNFEVSGQSAKGKGASTHLSIFCFRPRETPSHYFGIFSLFLSLRCSFYHRALLRGW